MNKPTLCLDFDGVLHSYTSGWQGADMISDPPVPGAIPWLIEAQKQFRIAIYSSRSKSLRGRWAMRIWLRRYVLAYMEQAEFDESGGVARDWTRDVMREIRWPWFKPAAFLTIDDRALCFDGTWPDLDALRSFKPWNK